MNENQFCGTKQLSISVNLTCIRLQAKCCNCYLTHFIVSHQMLMELLVCNRPILLISSNLLRGNNSPLEENMHLNLVAIGFFCY